MQKTNTENPQIDSNPEQQVARRSTAGVLTKLALGAGAVASLTAGAYIGSAIHDSYERVKQLEQEVEDNNNDIEFLEDETQKKITFLSELAGVDEQSYMEHENRSEIPRIEFFPTDIAEKQDSATMHLIGFTIDESGVVVDDAISSHRCNVVKIGDDIVSTAAHCTDTIFADLSDQDQSQTKGGGEYSPPESWTSSGVEYFVSDSPSLSYGEAKAKAMKVTGYGTNSYYAEGDGSIMQLSPPVSGDDTWFSEIESLDPATSAPLVGEVVRVSGDTYINGDVVRVSHNGVVLGVAPPSMFGYTYLEDLTIVGINVQSLEEAFSCNLGESGSTLVTSEGKSYGALAYVGQSSDPNNLQQPSANTPETEKVLELEKLLDVKLLGENYVLCGYSRTSDIEVQPISTFSQTVVSPGE